MKKKNNKKKVKIMLAAKREIENPMNRNAHCIALHNKLAAQVKLAGISDEQLIDDVKSIREDVRRNRSKRKN